MVSCKARPVKCNSYYHDHTWEVHSFHAVANATAANASVNETSTVGKPHVLVSTLDVAMSCDSIVCILCLQILRRSLKSPQTTNVIKVGS